MQHFFCYCQDEWSILNTSQYSFDVWSLFANATLVNLQESKSIIYIYIYMISVCKYDWIHDMLGFDHFDQQLLVGKPIDTCCFTGRPWFSWWSPWGKDGCLRSWEWPVLRARIWVYTLTQRWWVDDHHQFYQQWFNDHQLSCLLFPIGVLIC